MRRSILIGIFFVLATPALADEQWSAETCSRLREIKSTVAAEKVDAYHKAIEIQPILYHQKLHCGVDIQKEFAASIKTINAGDPAYTKLIAAYEKVIATGDALKARDAARLSETKRRSLSCYTYNMGGGDSSTNCD